MAINLLEEADKEIKTGNGYQNDLIATANHRIKISINAVSELIKLVEKTITAQKETTSSLTSLESTIKKLDEKNEKLQKAFLALTIVATIFTVLQFVQVVDIILRWVAK